MKSIHPGAWILLGAGFAACTPGPAAVAERVIAPWTAELGPAGTGTPSGQAAPTATSTLPPLAGISPTRIPGQPYPTPTPDAIRTPPPISKVWVATIICPATSGVVGTTMQGALGTIEPRTVVPLA